MQRSTTNRPKQYAWRSQRLYKFWWASCMVGSIAFPVACCLAVFGHLEWFLVILILVLERINFKAFRKMVKQREVDLQHRLETPSFGDISLFIEMLSWNLHDYAKKQQVLERQKAIRRAIGIALLEANIDDYAELTESDRVFLNKALVRSDIDLVRAVLTAWERGGENSAIPNVARLAAGRAYAAISPSIQRQAQDCLIILQERAALEQFAGTLLRASAAETSPDILLRPAYTTPLNAESDAQLLRATTDKENVSPS